MVTQLTYPAVSGDGSAIGILLRVIFNPVENSEHPLLRRIENAKSQRKNFCAPRILNGVIYA